MKFENKETHDSYGMIGLVRMTGGDKNLFGSSIKHHSTMCLKVKRCERKRDLNRDWYHGTDVLVEIELSPVQFAEMITAVGVGDGVPCTIRRTENNWGIEDPPETSQRLLFEEEFQSSMDEVASTCYGDVKEVDALLLKKGTITVKERKAVSNIINRVISNITSHLPFIQYSFNKAMDKTTLEAKGEVEAFITNKIHSLGLEAMKDQLPTLTIESGDSAAKQIESTEA
jgi:hypothetical protein